MQTNTPCELLTATMPVGPGDLLGVTVKFKTIYLDPPWQICTGGKGGWGTPQNHYAVMPTQDIINSLQWLKPHIAEQAHCYLWVVNNKLMDGLELMREVGFTYITNNTLDTTTFQNLWRPSQSGSPIVVSTRSAIAQSYACLVNSACVYVYVDFVQGSSQDSQGNGGLLGVVPLNASNNSVGYYDKVMSNDLLKIPSQLQEITVFFKDERLNNFLLPRSAIANLELGFTYY